MFFLLPVFVSLWRRSLSLGVVLPIIGVAKIIDSTIVHEAFSRLKSCLLKTIQWMFDFSSGMRCLQKKRTSVCLSIYQLPTCLAMSLYGYLSVYFLCIYQLWCTFLRSISLSLFSFLTCLEIHRDRQASCLVQSCLYREKKRKRKGGGEQVERGRVSKRREFYLETRPRSTN